MPKAVIYDFDGVIVKSLEVHLKAYLYSLLRLGINATNQEVIEKCFNKIDPVAAGNFGITDIQSFSQYYLEAVTEGYKHLTLYPHVTFAIQSLHASGILIGLGSLRETKNVEYALEVLELGSLFDAVVTPSKEKRKKPEIFREVCKKLHTKLADVVVVGDAENDIVAAKEMGSVSILFYPEEHREFYEIEKLKKFKPDYIIKNHRQVLSIVGNRGV